MLPSAFIEAIIENRQSSEFCIGIQARQASRLTLFPPKYLFKLWRNYKFGEYLEGLSLGIGMNAQSP